MPISAGPDVQGSPAAKGRSPFFLVVNIGDSNAAGFSEAVQANLAEGAEPYGFADGVFQFDGSGFVPTNVATNIRQTTGKNAAWTLAKAIAAQGTQVGIVDVSVDGTKMADAGQGWNPVGANANSPFTSSAEIIRDAIAAGGYIGCYYICCNANDPREGNFTPAQTLAAYQALIAQLRGQLDSGSSVTDGLGALTDRPVLIAGVADRLQQAGLDITTAPFTGSANAGDYQLIDQNLRFLADTLDGVEYVSAEGLELADQGFAGAQPRIHFTDEAQESLGFRAFKALQQARVRRAELREARYRRGFGRVENQSGANLAVWQRYEPWAAAAFRYNLLKGGELAVLSGNPSFDRNGYPIAPAAGEVQLRLFVDTKTALDSVPSELYRAGRYYIYTEGTGGFTSAGGDAPSVSGPVVTPRGNRFEVQVQNPNLGIFLNFDAGSRFTSIRVVHEGDEHYTEEHPWDEKLIEDLRGADFLRFMQPLNITGSIGNFQATGMDDRARWESATWDGGRFPMRAAASLCSEIQCDVWWNLPHETMGNVDYAKADALDFKRYADPRCALRVEGTNEVWNSGLGNGAHFTYLSDQATNVYGFTDPTPGQKEYRAYMELMSVSWCAMEEVLGDQRGRLIRMGGTQNGNLGVLFWLLEHEIEGTPGIDVNAKEIGLKVYQTPLRVCTAPYSPGIPTDIGADLIQNLSIPATQSELNAVRDAFKADSLAGWIPDSQAIVDQLANYHNSDFGSPNPALVSTILDTYEFGMQVHVPNADADNEVRMRQWKASAQCAELMEWMTGQWRAISKGACTWYWAFSRGGASGADFISFEFARWQGQSTKPVLDGSASLTAHPLLGVWQVDSRKESGAKQRRPQSLAATNEFPKGALKGDRFPMSAQARPGGILALQGDHLEALRDNASPTDPNDWRRWATDYAARTQTLNSSATTSGLTVTSKGGFIRNRAGEHVLDITGNIVVPGLAGEQFFCNQNVADPNGATITWYDLQGTNASAYRSTADEIAVNTVFPDLPLTGRYVKGLAASVPGLSSGQTARFDLTYGFASQLTGGTLYRPKFAGLCLAPGLNGRSPATGQSEQRFGGWDFTDWYAETYLGVNGSPGLSRYGFRVEAGSDASPAINQNQVKARMAGAARSLVLAKTTTGAVGIAAEGDRINVYDGDPDAGGTIKAFILDTGDIEVIDASAGVILKGATNGTRARLTIDDTTPASPTLVVTAL